jgi:hypothetical protein
MRWKLPSAAARLKSVSPPPKLAKQVGSMAKRLTKNCMVLELIENDIECGTAKTAEVYRPG